MASIGPQPTQSAEGFLHGKLLIAMPAMPDPRFEKSVVFMCSHSDKGAMGLIVNKPIEDLTFRELMDKLSVRVTANTPDMPVMFGGPVQTGRGFVLHSADYESAEATMRITADIALTATVDLLSAVAEGRGPEKSLLALGYAGWGPGQIEAEIMDNGWIHCDADKDILFDAAPNEKWRLALGKLGAAISGLSSEAGRA